MKSLLWILIAVFCNVGAQLSLKAGAIANMQWQDYLSPKLLLGVMLYGISLILTVRIYSVYPLSIISPLMAGAIFVLVTFGASLFFSEPITTHKIVGVALIVAGIALLARAS